MKFIQKAAGVPEASMNSKWSLYDPVTQTRVKMNELWSKKIKFSISFSQDLNWQEQKAQTICFALTRVKFKAKWNYCKY